MTTLFVPWMLVGLGIVLRGARSPSASLLPTSARPDWRASSLQARP